MTRVRSTSRRLRRTAAFSGAAALLLCTGTLSSNAAEDTRYRGLPSQHVGPAIPRATGLTQTKTALQWVRMPAMQNLAFVPTVTIRKDTSCRRLAPYTEVQDYFADIFAVSPAGSPARFGYIGPFTARTVAFGAIPVQASIRLRQVRDDDNLPTPIKAHQQSGSYCPGAGPHAGPGEVEKMIRDTTATGRVELEITALIVDGVDLRLGRACQAAAPIDLNLTAPDLQDLDPSLGDDDPWEAPEPAGEVGNLRRTMTSPYFFFTFGGLLSATIDIPPFAGCTTATGEDISRLLTATISGPNNQVQIRAEALALSASGNPCWETHTCEGLPDMPLPGRTP